MTIKQTRKRAIRKETASSFGQDLVEAMQEVVAIECGRKRPMCANDACLGVYRRARQVIKEAGFC